MFLLDKKFRNSKIPPTCPSIERVRHLAAALHILLVDHYTSMMMKVAASRGADILSMSGWFVWGGSSAEYWLIFLDLLICVWICGCICGHIFGHICEWM